MKSIEEPHERYVTIATRCFADAGFHGVSLAAIAREAGVSKQALLHFFATKERLYAAVLTDLSDRMCARLDNGPDLPPRARLDAHFDALVDHCLTDPTDARLVVRALLDSRPGAKRWPLKPFLDRLETLTAAAYPEADPTAIKPALFHLLGGTHYVAIATDTLDGMYGAAMAAEIKTACRAKFVQHLHADLARG